MVMLDTNMILRYLLNDNEEMADEVEKIINENSVHVTTEVIAEAVYVLKGVYHIDKELIKSSLTDFLEEVYTAEADVIKLAFETYAKQNLDFVDCILYAYNKIKGYEIKTFDKKLKHLLIQREF